VNSDPFRASNTSGRRLARQLSKSRLWAQNWPVNFNIVASLFFLTLR
jgi:hypothetical protein